METFVQYESFGESLRFWRELHRKTQLELSLDLEISTKHLSFLENNRSKPSRDLVLRIAEILKLPLRQRNTFLQSAGYSPGFRESSLSSETMQTVSQALDRLLEKQEPYPAFVVDSSYQILKFNSGYQKIIEKFASPDCLQRTQNAIEIMVVEEGLKHSVQGYEMVMAILQRRIWEEMTITQNPKLKEVYERCFPKGNLSPLPPLVDIQLPILTLYLQKGNHVAQLFSTITTLGSPSDITAQEIKLELFFPLDEETKRMLGEK